MKRSLLTSKIALVAIIVFGCRLDASGKDPENFSKTVKPGLGVCESLLLESNLAFSVKGTVTSDEGEPLPGVSVSVKGTTIGTTTDVEGKYSLEVPDDKVILVFSFIGKTPEEASVNGQSIVNMVLLPDIMSLQEFVVVGYGKVKRNDLTGSISQIKGESIQEFPITSMEQGMQGRVTGVQVIQSSGQPGSGLSVRIRGNSSIAGGNEPLYVIDGFPLYNNDAKNLNGLSSINPDDIESIEILKDASSTAIYGSRGANGVVMITTKMAKDGENKINFDSYYGIQQVRKKLDLLDGKEYAEWANTALTNNGSAPIFDLNNLQANTDWQDEIFRTAAIQNYNLSYSGGTQKAQYLISGNYFDQQGIILNSGFSRGSVRINMNNEVNKKLKIQSRLLLSRSMQNGSVSPDGSAALTSYKSVVGSALAAAPTISVRDGNNYSEMSPYSFSSPDLENPVALAQEVVNKRAALRILAGVNINYEIINGLTNSLRLGADYLGGKSDYYVPSIFKSLGSGSGDASQTFTQGSTYLLENTLNYNKNIGFGTIDLLAGYAYQYSKTNSIFASSLGFISDDLENASLQAGSSFGIPRSTERDSTLISWFGRIRFNLKEKYLFAVSGRYDGASVFSKNNKHGFFPSASFAWKINEEGFLKNTFISNLKLRLSWGQSGNPAIPAYQSLSVSSPIQTSIGDNLNLALAPTRLANPNLKWETTTQSNIGLDMGFLKERFRITADYYVKNTKDLLATIILPPSSGFQSIIDNVGASQNTGFELGLGFDVLENKPLTWTVDGNFSTNKNKITKTRNGEDIFGPPTRTGSPSLHVIREGQPLAAYYGTVFNGIGEDGLYRYLDQNSDGKIDGADRVILGKAFPDFIYGFNSVLKFKNFDLTLFIQGVNGVDIINNTTPRGVDPETNAIRLIPERNAVKEVLNYYPKAGANFESPTTKSVNRPTVNPGFSSFNVEDGSYVRLKNIKIGYKVPIQNLDWKYINSIYVYLSGQNLLTKTDYTGYDPEVNSFGGNDLRVGVDYGTYPSAKTYTIGLKLSF